MDGSKLLIATQQTFYLVIYRHVPLLRISCQLLTKCLSFLQEGKTDVAELLSSMLHQQIVEIFDVLRGLAHHLSVAYQVALTSLIPEVTLLVEVCHVGMGLLQLILHVCNKILLLLYLLKLSVNEAQILQHMLNGRDIVIRHIEEVVRHIEIIGIGHRLAKLIEDGTSLDRPWEEGC